MDFPIFEEVIEWKGDELKKMKNLKTLIIKNARFSKGPKYLPNSLRVLEWPGYPSQDIPSDFCARELSICKLPASDLTSFELHGSLKARVIISFLSSCIPIHHFMSIHFFLNVFAFTCRRS